MKQIKSHLVCIAGFMSISKPREKILIRSNIDLIFIEYLFVAYVLLFFRCFVCIDVDECAEGLRTCDEQSFCRNTEGSSTCVGNYCISAIHGQIYAKYAHLWNLILSRIVSFKLITPLVLSVVNQCNACIQTSWFSLTSNNERHIFKVISIEEATFVYPVTPWEHFCQIDLSHSLIVS